MFVGIIIVSAYLDGYSVFIAEIDAQQAEQSWHTHKTSSHRAVNCDDEIGQQLAKLPSKAEQKRMQWEKERGRHKCFFFF